MSLSGQGALGKMSEECADFQVNSFFIALSPFHFILPGIFLTICRMPFYFSENKRFIFFNKFSFESGRKSVKISELWWVKSDKFGWFQLISAAKNFFNKTPLCELHKKHAQKLMCEEKRRINNKIL